MASVTTCPEDRVFREVLLGDATLVVELEIARHLTECDKCAARMQSALSSEQTRNTIQKRGEDRPLWQYYVDASKLMGSAATVRRDDGVEATLHLPKNPSRPPSKEVEVGETPLASGDEEQPLTMQVAASIYSFLAPPEAKDEIGRLGGYRITKLLGAGGMGMVFQAEDLQLRRKVALKVMRPEVAAIVNAHDRFLREARTMASIEHDHVVAVFQVGEERGVPFVAMPFLQGMPLDTVLKKNPAIPLMISLRMGFQIANGLAAAHARGLIHRDIKPANIWIETQNNNRIKLLDFGLARGNDEEINLTQSGAVLGTPAYMAPEQAAGGAIDARADLFSLGVVLYELTTGKRPFAGPGTMAILTALAIHNPPSPRELNESIPENASDFIMRLLQKDPAQRVGSAQEAARELASFIKAKAAELKETPIAGDTVGGGLGLPTIRAIPRHRELSPPSRPALVAAVIADTGGAKRRNLIWAAIGGGILGLLAITFAVVTIFMRTPYGTLEVKIDDPSVEARFKNGSLILTDDTGKVRYTLRPAEELTDKNEKIEAGNYKLRVEGADGLTVDTEAFSLKDGKREVVRVILKPNSNRDTSVVAIPDSAAKTDSPDRQFAQWLLENKFHGELLLDEKIVPFGQGIPLPDTPFFVSMLFDSTSAPMSEEVLAEGLRRLSKLTKFRGGNLPKYQSDRWAKAFKELGSAEIVNAYVSEITDQGIAEVAQLPKLKYLNLDGSKRISLAGLFALTRCAHLETLELDGKTVKEGKFPLAELQRLQDALPHTKIQLADGIPIEGLKRAGAELNSK